MAVVGTGLAAPAGMGEVGIPGAAAVGAGCGIIGAGCGRGADVGMACSGGVGMGGASPGG